MAKKKACKQCKMFVVENDLCPSCKGNRFSTTWLGRITITNVEKSEIAQKIGIEKAGEYAIKVR